MQIGANVVRVSPVQSLRVPHLGESHICFTALLSPSRNSSSFLSKGPHIFILDRDPPIMSPVLSAIKTEWALTFICKLKRDSNFVSLLSNQASDTYVNLASLPGLPSIKLGDLFDE